MHFDEQGKYNTTKGSERTAPTGDTGGEGSGGGNAWTTGTETQCADNCSYAEKNVNEATIHIPYEILKVIGYLCDTIQVEWQMLLKGTEEVVDGKMKVEVTGYYIPKQEVSASTVRNIDDISRKFLKENNIVAGIHSHSDMGVFFSSVDEETNKSAIRHHLVVNNKLEFIARSRFTLPCGMEFFKDAKIDLDTPPKKPMVIDGFTNIDKTVPAYDADSWTTNGHVTDYSKKWAGKTIWPETGKTITTLEDVSRMAGHMPDTKDAEAEQIELFNKFRSNNNKIIQVDSEGLVDVQGMYDPINDIYFMDDQTIIYGFNTAYNHHTSERYIYAGADPTK